MSIRKDPRQELDDVIALIRTGKLRSALAVATRILSASEGDDLLAGKAYARLGEIHGMLGDFDECHRCYGLAVERLERTKFRGTPARAMRGQAFAYLCEGEHDRALETLREAQKSLSRVTDAIRWRAEIEFHLWCGLVQARTRNVGRVRDHAEKAEELIERPHPDEETAAARARRGERVGPRGAGAADPLLVGLTALVGGLARITVWSERSEGLKRFAAAAATFEKEGMPYYEALARDYWGRAMFDPEQIEKAIALFGRIGAGHYADDARRWLDQRPYARPLPVSGKVIESLGEYFIAGPNSLDLFQDILRVAEGDLWVSIRGERGTGKEPIARLIHILSNRRNGPFVPVNVGETPPDVVASDLFGHVKGAFTGATADKRGLVEMADGGTLFLDEVGNLTPEVQQMLLRVFQDGRVRRIGAGSATRRKVDFRLVTATNANLYRKSTMQPDFVDRIDSWHTLETTPLRERRGEIRLLVDHFVRHYVSRRKLKGISLDQECYKLLREYDWHGNVRELQGFCETMVDITRRGRVDPELIRTRLSSARQRSAMRSPTERAPEADALARAEPSPTPGAAEAVARPPALPEDGGQRDYLAEVTRFLWSRDPREAIDWFVVRDGLERQVAAHALRVQGSQTAAGRAMSVSQGSIRKFLASATGPRGGDRPTEASRGSRSGSKDGRGVGRVVGES